MLIKVHVMNKHHTVKPVKMNINTQDDRKTLPVLTCDRCTGRAGGWPAGEPR